MTLAETDLIIYNARQAIADSTGLPVDRLDLELWYACTCSPDMPQGGPGQDCWKCHPEQRPLVAL